MENLRAVLARSIPGVVFGVISIGFLVVALVAFRRLPTPQHSADATLADRLAVCIGAQKADNRFACFRRVLHPEMDARSPRALLQELDRLEQEQPRFSSYCHEMAHVLGRYWITKGRTITDGFHEGSNQCHSGFYHGMVERVIRGEAADTFGDVEHVPIEALRAKIPTICTHERLETASRNYRFQCLHGLGHALMFSLGYRLPIALELCDALSDDWSQNSCAGGAFMENISGPEKDRRMLRAGDPHYPCSIVDAKYRDSCYGMQTSWMREMGMSWEAIIEACRGAGAYRLACFQSLGRDSSSHVRVEGPAKYAALCAQLTNADERYRCVRGAVNALTDHTWDARYAYPYCAAFGLTRDRQECFTESSKHLLIALEQPREKLLEACQALLGETRDTCLRVVSRV